jgi:hypothetical protein
MVYGGRHTSSIRPRSGPTQALQKSIGRFRVRSPKNSFGGSVNFKQESGMAMKCEGIHHTCPEVKQECRVGFTACEVRQTAGARNLSRLDQQARLVWLAVEAFLHELLRSCTEMAGNERERGSGKEGEGGGREKRGRCTPCTQRQEGEGDTHIHTHTHRERERERERGVEERVIGHRKSTNFIPGHGQKRSTELGRPPHPRQLFTYLVWQGSVTCCCS